MNTSYSGIGLAACVLALLLSDSNTLPLALKTLGGGQTVAEGRGHSGRGHAGIENEQIHILPEGKGDSLIRANPPLYSWQSETFLAVARHRHVPYPCSFAEEASAAH